MRTAPEGNIEFLVGEGKFTLVVHKPCGKVTHLEGYPNVSPEFCRHCAGELIYAEHYEW